MTQTETQNRHVAAFFDPFVGYLLHRYVRTGDMVLDIGCGPAFYRGAVKGRYIGVDVTDTPMSETMPRDLDAAATGDRLPFPDGTFDLVMSKSALYLMANPAATLVEVCRVLKPNGRVLLIDYNRRTQRKLEATTDGPLACWTQFELRDLVSRSGFRNCEILSTLVRDMGPIERLIRPLLAELFGTWAIVTAVK